MKKHVRFCLFAALLVALLGVTVLCAAAAGNYQVLNDADAEVGTYATLAAAKASGLPWQTPARSVVFRLADGNYDRNGKKLD